MGLPALHAKRNPKYFRPQEEAAILAEIAARDRERMEHAAVAVSAPVFPADPAPPEERLAFDFYTNSHHSFTGSEAKAYAFVGGRRGRPAVPPIELDTLTTISYSVFRDKYEVKAVGSSNVKGRTSGTRTIAGTMIFSHGAEHPLMRILRTNHVRTTYSGSFYADEILPIDIGITFLQSVAGVAGAEWILSQIWLRGVEFNTESLTVSINQSLTEKPLQYVAAAVDYMHRVGDELPGRRMEGAQDAVTGPQFSATNELIVDSADMVSPDEATNSLDAQATALDRRSQAGDASLAAQMGEVAGSRSRLQPVPAHAWSPPASTLPSQPDLMADLLNEYKPPSLTMAWDRLRERAGVDPADAAALQRAIGHRESPHTGPRPIEFATDAERARESVRWNDEAKSYMRSFRPNQRPTPPDLMVDLLHEYKPPSSTMAWERTGRDRQ